MADSQSLLLMANIKGDQPLATSPQSGPAAIRSSARRAPRAPRCTAASTGERPWASVADNAAFTSPCARKASANTAWHAALYDTAWPSVEPRISISPGSAPSAPPSPSSARLRNICSSSQCSATSRRTRRSACRSAQGKWLSTIAPMLQLNRRSHKPGSATPAAHELPVLLKRLRGVRWSSSLEADGPEPRSLRLQARYTSAAIAPPSTHWDVSRAENVEGRIELMVRLGRA
mmetsp:Transcript_61264/g.200302  ORF Transcript_61264/g.200302 Transcript_61264/m.200302 type:complete len:232 (-) Transcript_61264:43-738(-)